MNQLPAKIRIGTRASKLALAQANIVAEQLRLVQPGIVIEIVKIITTGDQIQDKNLAEIGGKGLFIKEIEEYLLAGKIDIAVHSLKDMPAVISDNFEIPCVLPRADARDAFVSLKYKSLQELPLGASIGTSSARRAAQVLNLRPDLKISPFRGNVNTRLDKIAAGVVDATFLAMAGLLRTGLFNSKMMHPLTIDQMLPAVSQGAIGIEILNNNNNIRNLLAAINHQPSFIACNIERNFMRVFEGSCTTPIAAYAAIDTDKIYLKCLIAKPDGSCIHRLESNARLNNCAQMGKNDALKLQQLAGDNFFA